MSKGIHVVTSNDCYQEIIVPDEFAFFFAFYNACSKSIADFKGTLANAGNFA
jgi:hypothetical protein